MKNKRKLYYLWVESPYILFQDAHLNVVDWVATEEFLIMTTSSDRAMKKVASRLTAVSGNLRNALEKQQPIFKGRKGYRIYCSEVEKLDPSSWMMTNNTKARKETVLSFIC